MHALDSLFNPRSVAVIGAADGDITKAGFGYFAGLADLGVIKNLYPVNLTGDSVLGFPGYRSVRDIHEAIDYAIFAIPAKAVPGVMKDCAENGVKFAHLFTAGMSETGEEEDERLEDETLNIAHRSGIRLLGPNCLGIYSPSTGLTFYPGLSKQSGLIGVISQSGSIAEDLIRLGGMRGVHYSRVVSFGNASDINESDLLEYLADDAETKFVAIYIEGVTDGKRFYKSLRKLARCKPVVLLKGGKTEAGCRAATSHTGSLAGNAQMWSSLTKQAGVISVGSVDEMLDALLTLILFPAVRGLNVALVGEGGGVSVLASDDCAEAGLGMPSFPENIKAKLRSFVPKAGTSIRNPVDAAISLQSPTDVQSLLNLVAGFDAIDFLIVHIGIDWVMLLPDGRKRLDGIVTAVLKVGKCCGKPLAISLLSGGAPENCVVASELQQRCLKAGFPVYPSIARAASAISNVTKNRLR